MSSDGIDFCRHEYCVLDEREGFEVCTECAKVVDSLVTPTPTYSPPSPTPASIIRDFGRNGLHSSIIQTAELIMSQLSNVSYTDLEIAAYSIYMAGIIEGVDYSINEISKITRVHEGKLFKMIKDCRLKFARVDPAKLVERMISNEEMFSSLKYCETVSIQRRIRNFPREIVQSMTPETIVAAAIYLNCQQKLTIAAVSQACGVNKKSLSASVKLLREKAQQQQQQEEEVEV